MFSRISIRGSVGSLEGTNRVLQDAFTHIGLYCPPAYDISGRFEYLCEVLRQCKV